MKLVKITAFLALVWGASAPSFAEEPLRDSVPPSSFCDRGYFEHKGTRYSFPDITIEGNRVISIGNNGYFSAYGYIGQLRLASDPFEETRAVFFGEGECLRGINTVNPDSNTSIDIIFDPRKVDAYDYKRIRAELLKVTSGFNTKALVKVTGQFGIYSNTGAPFFSATTLETVSLAE